MRRTASGHDGSRKYRTAAGHDGSNSQQSAKNTFIIRTKRYLQRALEQCVMLNEDLCAGRTNVELAKVDLIVIRGDFLADGGTEEHWQEYVIRHMRYGHYCLYLPLIEQTPPHPFWRLFDPKEK